VREYIRSYLVYEPLRRRYCNVWLMVDFAAIPFWIAQGGVIMVTVIFSYIGHSRFTFVKKQ